MRILRTVHLVGAILSGIALALAVLDHARGAAALLAVVVILQLFSLEGLRALTVSQPWSKKP